MSAHFISVQIFFGGNFLLITDHLWGRQKWYFGLSLLTFMKKQKHWILGHNFSQKKYPFMFILLQSGQTHTHCKVCNCKNCHSGKKPIIIQWASIIIQILFKDPKSLFFQTCKITYKLTGMFFCPPKKLRTKNAKYALI